MINPANTNIIIVDDDYEIRALLQDFFNSKGYQTTTFSLATEALKAIETQVPNSPTEEPNNRVVEVVISDIKMPEMTGLEFVQRLKKVRQDMPVVLVTAFGNIRTAVKAIQNGAQDYILKPFKLSQVIESVERAIKYLKEKPQPALLTRSNDARGWLQISELIGESASMLEVFNIIGRVSRTSANVLVTGESGTGKELVAMAIHKNSSRASKPIIAINCSAIPETLLESELFGHAKGSFTGAIEYRRGLFQEADGGTVFLDEIGDMNLMLQTKLLRVIQERKIKAIGTNTYRDVDVRIIVATHRDLKKEVKEGRFREDLFYRLNVIPISLPPLRNRKEDIPILAKHFLQKFAQTNNCNIFGFSKQALDKLIAFPWKGNVRELSNVIERAVILCNGDQIEEQNIITDDDSDLDQLLNIRSPELPTLSEFENQYIKFILKKTQGQKEKAAKILGIDRKTLYRKEQLERTKDADRDVNREEDVNH